MIKRNVKDLDGKALFWSFKYARKADVLASGGKPSVKVLNAARAAMEGVNVLPPIRSELVDLMLQKKINTQQIRSDYCVAFRASLNGLSAQGGTDYVFHIPSHLVFSDNRPEPAIMRCYIQSVLGDIVDAIPESML